MSWPQFLKKVADDRGEPSCLPKFNRSTLHTSRITTGVCVAIAIHALCYNIYSILFLRLNGLYYLDTVLRRRRPLWTTCCPIQPRRDKSRAHPGSKYFSIVTFSYTGSAKAFSFSSPRAAIALRGRIHLPVDPLYGEADRQEQSPTNGHTPSHIAREDHIQFERDPPLQLTDSVAHGRCSAPSSALGTGVEWSLPQRSRSLEQEGTKH